MFVLLYFILSHLIFTQVLIIIIDVLYPFYVSRKYDLNNWLYRVSVSLSRFYRDKWSLFPCRANTILQSVTAITRPIIYSSTPQAPMNHIRSRIRNSK